MVSRGCCTWQVKYTDCWFVTTTNQPTTQTISPPSSSLGYTLKCSHNLAVTHSLCNSFEIDPHFQTQLTPKHTSSHLNTHEHTRTHTNTLTDLLSDPATIQTASLHHMGNLGVQRLLEGSAKLRSAYGPGSGKPQHPDIETYMRKHGGKDPFGKCWGWL